MRYDHLPLETRDGRRIEVEFVSNVYQVDSGRSPSATSATSASATGWRRSSQAQRR